MNRQKVSKPHSIVSPPTLCPASAAKKVDSLKNII